MPRAKTPIGLTEFPKSACRIPTSRRKEIVQLLTDLSKVTVRVGVSGKRSTQDTSQAATIPPRATLINSIRRIRTFSTHLLKHPKPITILRPLVKSTAMLPTSA